MDVAKIVGILLDEDQYYPAFDGSPYGYLGTVDADLHVKATLIDLDAEHQQQGMSFHDARWRYATNRKVPTVGWSNDCTEEQKQAVTQWLQQRGYRVAGHVMNLDKWFWP